MANAEKNPLPRSANDWQLYTSKRGCGAAAKELSKALSEALKELRATSPRNTDMAYALHNKHYRPVAEKYAQLGAADTEPSDVFLCALLDRI